MATNLGERTLTWLTKEGYSTESIKQEGFSSSYWAFHPSLPKNKFSVSQADGDDKIVLATGIFLADEDQARMSKLSPPKRLYIVRELSKLIYSFDIAAFRIDEEEWVLKGVTFTYSIFADGLSKDRFMGAVSTLYRAQAAVLLYLSDYLGWEISGGEKTPSPVGAGMKFCTSCGKPVRADANVCPACSSQQT